MQFMSPNVIRFSASNCITYVKIVEIGANMRKFYNFLYKQLDAGM